MKELCTTMTGLPGSSIRKMFNMAQKMDNLISFSLGEPGYVAAEHNIVLMYKNEITADGQKCPEHQKVLRRYAVHLQAIVHPVEQRVRTDALVGCFP